MLIIKAFFIQTILFKIMLYNMKISSMRLNKLTKNFKYPNSILKVRLKIFSLVQKKIGSTMP